VTANGDGETANGQTTTRWDAPPLVEVAPNGERFLVQPIGPRVVAKTPLNTPRDTWNWMRQDALGRIAPLLLAAWAYERFTPWGKDDLGVRNDAPLSDLALGVAVGLPFSMIAAIFRRWVAPRYKLPTPADQVTQSAYYFLINAPAEELFFRGLMQSLTTRGLRKVPGLRRVAGPLGWVVASTAYGGYHRFGNWSWRSIAGVTAAGGLFGALFALPKRRSIWPAVIAHGFATAGFLSWADVALYRRNLRQLRRQYASEETPGASGADPAAGQ
jgi:membrane protease YdiL (CAAX protease family)